MSHANARLTVHGRVELIRRVIEQGRPVAHVVKELNISRATGYKWVRRWRAEGLAGLHDRPSRAHHQPAKTPAEVEHPVLTLRRERKLGPARIGPWSDWPPRPPMRCCAATGCTGWPGWTDPPVNGSAATNATDLGNWSTST